jgi:hypothetical protein
MSPKEKVEKSLLAFKAHQELRERVAEVWWRLFHEKPTNAATTTLATFAELRGFEAIEQWLTRAAMEEIPPQNVIRFVRHQAKHFH